MFPRFMQQDLSLIHIWMCKRDRDYIRALEAMSGSRISAIGVGPEREQVVVRHDLLD